MSVYNKFIVKIKGDFVVKYCSKCGAELHDEAVVCPKCGCAVDGVKVVNDQNATPQKKNVIALVGFILSFFVAIAGLICGIIGLVQSKKLNEEGKGFAVAAVAISAASLVLSIYFIVHFLVLMAALVG